MCHFNKFYPLLILLPLNFLYQNNIDLYHRAISNYGDVRNEHFQAHLIS